MMVSCSHSPCNPGMVEGSPLSWLLVGHNKSKIGQANSIETDQLIISCLICMYILFITASVVFYVSYLSYRISKPNICICENRQISCAVIDCTIRLASTYIQNFKLLAFFCDFTEWFVLELV